MEAHSLILPTGIKGNIFKVEGNYVVTAVSMDKSMFDNKIRPERVKLEISLSGVNQLKEVYLFSADVKKKQKIGYILKGGETIKITIPNHKTASMILLSKTKIGKNQ